MPPIAMLISLGTALILMACFAVFRTVVLLRRRTPTTVRSLAISLVAIAIFLPGWLAVNFLRDHGLPIPRPGMPDRASGEQVVIAAIAVVVAYLSAIACVRGWSWLRSPEASA